MGHLTMLEPPAHEIEPFYGIFANGVVLVKWAEGRRSLGSRRLVLVLPVYRISENAIGLLCAQGGKLYAKTGSISAGEQAARNQ